MIFELPRGRAGHRITDRFEVKRPHLDDELFRVEAAEEDAGDGEQKRSPVDPAVSPDEISAEEITDDQSGQYGADKVRRVTEGIRRKILDPEAVCEQHYLGEQCPGGGDQRTGDR